MKRVSVENLFQECGVNPKTKDRFCRIVDELGFCQGIVDGKAYEAFCRTDLTNQITIFSPVAIAIIQDLSP